MTYNVQYFEETQADEFAAVAKLLKKKLTVNGWGTFGYDQYHYNLDGTRKPGNDGSVVFFYPEESTDPIAEASTENTAPVPIKRGRGRAVAPSSNRVPHKKPTSDRVNVSRFKSIALNYDSEEDTDDSIAHYCNLHKLPRIIWLKDLESPTLLSKRLETIANGTSRIGSIERVRANKLTGRKHVLATGFLIEGIHFNENPEEIKRLKVQNVSFSNVKFYKLDKFLLSNKASHHTTMRRYLRTQPIDKSQFLEAITSHFLTRLDTTRKNKAKELTNLRNKLFTLEKEMGEIIFIETAVGNSSDKHFGDIIQAIEKIPAVAKLEFNGNGFVITTKDIWVECGENDHYLGVYEISIELTKDLKAFFRNIASPQTAEYSNQHPHGSCKGSHHSAMLSALRSLDYYTFVLAAIETLQTVNPREKTSESLESGGWPQVKPKKTFTHTGTVSLMDEERSNPVREHDGITDDDSLDDEDMDDDEEH